MPGDNDLITSKCITFHATTSALAVDIRVVVVVVAIAVVFAIVAVAIVGIVASAASVVTLL